jgi:hypothetical protein
VFVSPWDGSVISLLDRFVVEQTVLFFFFWSKADSSVRPDGQGRISGHGALSV